jgi:peroxiredoxin
MKKYRLIFVVMFLVFGFLCTASAQRVEKLQGRLPIPAPDFELADINQDTYTLSNYKNQQPVLLFFWTTWCPYCRRELNTLNNMYATLSKDGIEVLAINIGELPSRVESFVKGYYLAYRVLLDKDTSVSNSYGVIGVPTYTLIDKSGNIVFQDNFLPRQEYKDLITK